MATSTGEVLRRSLHGGLSPSRGFARAILGLSPVACISGWAALTVLAMLGDYLTGPTRGFILFYLPGLFMLAWRFGGWGVLVGSLASGVAWGGLHAYEAGRELPPAIILWNSFASTVLLIVAAAPISFLRSEFRALEHLAMRDPLTGVHNSRSFAQLSHRELERARRHQRPVSLLYIDLDDFKQLNDTFGHGVGDEALATIASTIGLSLRNTDLLARLGGDEFAALLPEADSEAAMQVADRMLSTVRAAAESRNWKVSISIGVATADPPPLTVEELIAEGDRRMYAAKQAGKSRVSGSIQIPVAR